MADRLLLLTRRAAAGAAVFTVASLLLFAGSASAATFKVKSTADLDTGGCGAHCTLRDAVMAADLAGGSNTIDLPAGTYKLAILATNAGPTPTDNPAVGDLDINPGTSVTIDGAGSSKTTLNAAQVDRMFAVHDGASLTVSGVTVENGQEPDEGASDNGMSAGYGGAFYNDGTLKIEKSVLTDNSAEYAGGVIFSDENAKATTVTDSQVTLSSSGEDYGGGFLSAKAGTINLTGDTIEDSYAGATGAAVSGDEVGSVTVSDTTVEYNVSDNEGGAIYLYYPGDVSITGSTLSDNSSTQGGGGLWVEGAPTVQISHSAISDNASQSQGAGVYLDEIAGPITVTDTSFSNDMTGNSSDGGGIYADAFGGGRMTVTGSSFTDDYGQQGGGVYSDGEDLTVKSTHFTNDSAAGAGAIYLQGSGATAAETITDSVFAHDVATTNSAGAIDDDEGDLSVTASTFDHDTTTQDGGGLLFSSGDGLSLVNDTFASNLAEYGGAIYMSNASSNGPVTLLNDTIARNNAFEGGGIYDPYEANVIENTILADNAGSLDRGASTGDGNCEDPFDYFLRFADSGHNLDNDGSCIAGTTAPDDKTASPKLGQLANNGGPVPTDALLSGSPAIGAADHAACPTTDARGDKRPTKCDMGAYQTEPKPKPKKKKK